MSTELVSHATAITLTRFSWFEHGTAIAVCQPRWFKEELTAVDTVLTSIHLDKGQAAALAADLLDFAQGREEEIGT